ncbi:MAG TPA: thiamine pyrophosphate-dependent dehydrogenase E1 component subunit alpha, partial [Saprospiraceae bacterium]|nr:thiamine pyrophosphate-dependent dehydrogenase E1 component subunit alpha [Saprospiraceae bacterium]
MKPNNIDQAILKKAFTLLCTAKSITEVFEEQFKVVSKYVHATSRGHEAIQIAVGMQLTPKDYMSPYYRDDAMMLSIGMSPYDLMLQVLAKKNDPFSGGRSYYCHPSLKDDDKPKIPHQSSATGMQVIPATGVAMGIQYKEKLGLNTELGAIVVCSLGDASVTEGEISEALQMAALKQFPILYLVQDNGWDISATAAETRAMNAFEYAKGFPGIEAVSIDGSDFATCYQTLKNIIHTMRTERRPFLVHAKVPLLNHHTSGVRKEWYRDDIEEHKKNDPYDKLLLLVKESGISDEIINDIILESQNKVRTDLA